MRSLLPAPINREDLKAAPRQGPSMIMTQSIKIVLGTCVLSFLAIVMIILVIPLVLFASDPFLDRFLDRLEEMPRKP